MKIDDLKDSKLYLALGDFSRYIEVVRWTADTKGNILTLTFHVKGESREFTYTQKQIDEVIGFQKENTLTEVPKGNAEKHKLYFYIGYFVTFGVILGIIIGQIISKIIG